MPYYDVGSGEVVEGTRKCDVCRKNVADFDDPEDQSIKCSSCGSIACESCAVYSNSGDHLCFKCADNQSDEDQIEWLNHNFHSSLDNYS